MLKAVKGNKVYEIDEKTKKRYLEDGFDIYEDGKLKEYSPKKEVKYEDYKKLQDELVEVKNSVVSNEELTQKVSELEAELEKQKSTNVELVKANDEFVKSNDKLTKQIEKLKGNGAKEE